MHEFFHPEWPHRQGGCLTCCGCTFESLWGCTDLYYARGAQGVLPMRVGGATSQLDLPSLTQLSVAGCGWLQLGVPHWAASVHYCKLLIIEPTFCGSRFSTGRRLAIEDFTFYFLIMFYWTLLVFILPYLRGSGWIVGVELS